MTESKRPYVSVVLERDLLKKADYQCTQRKGLELEHKHPFAKGGSSDPKNLTVLCKGHNSLRAIEEYGVQKMQPFLRGLG